MKIRWITLIVIVLWGIILFYPIIPKGKEMVDPGRMYVNAGVVVCTQLYRGAMHCRNTKTGASWMVYTQVV